MQVPSSNVIPLARYTLSCWRPFQFEGKRSKQLAQVLNGLDYQRFPQLFDNASITADLFLPFLLELISLRIPWGYAGAKVSDHLVRLDYELKNGDIVELIPPRARQRPSPEWLSVRKDDGGNKYHAYARMRQTRSKIRNWFNKHGEEYKSKHNEMQYPKSQS